MPNPLIIAGPCSAENRQQVFATAHAVKEAGANIFRAGLWKPRTSPESFSGVGAQGIPWLREVQDNIGIPVATEVATTEHVKLCIDNGIRIFWIGARTTANPFLVQQVADAIASSGMAGDLTVMVKNPINPDLATWIGAIERFSAAGVKNIIAIHRGFSDSVTVSAKRQMRNDPLWSVPLALKRRYPEMLLLGDPSHLGGNSNMIGKLSLQALHLGMDGLIIEVHPEPENALSDAQQQISPDEFRLLMTYLQTPDPQTPDISAIQTLREEIDRIDTSLWSLIHERLKVAKQIGELKRVSGLSVYQEQRFTQILDNRLQWAKENGLDQKLVKQIMEAIHELAILEQL